MAPLSQLVHAWAPEVPGAKTDPSGFERDLAHLLLEDMVNCQLYETGPLVNGMRFGLRVITPGGQAAFLVGYQVRKLPSNAANSPEAASFIWEPESCS